MPSERKRAARRLRVALLTNIPTPYRVPVYRSLAGTPGWRLRVFASAATEPDRAWQVEAGGLDVEIPRSLSFRQRVRERDSVTRTVTRHLPVGLLRALYRFRPDVVVSGELGLRSLVAWLYGRLTGAPLVIWSYPSRAEGRAAERLRSLWRRWLLARARAVVGMGVQAREVLEGLGVPPGRLFDAPNSHDREGCDKALAGIDRDMNRLALRAGLGCREHVALVVGRMVASKGIAPLLRAWDGVPEATRAGWTLLCVGSGPLEAALRRAARLREPGEIVVVGAVQPREVVDFYAGADLLVFPTLWEPWGLVVNEALACGLPVLCSRLAGCADDLLRPGENGWLMDPNDPHAFAQALRDALEAPDLRQLGAAARASILEFTPERMASGFRAAVALALGDEVTAS